MVETVPSRSIRPNNHKLLTGQVMVPGLRYLAVLSCVAALAGPVSPAFAQGSNSEQKAADQQKDAAREAAKKSAEELAEAGRVVSGPAGHPECVWTGRRAVRLMFMDDLDTAFRHIELYDRFGCPGAHVQATFRCLVRQGTIDPKSDILDKRIFECWLNPTNAPAPTTAAAPPAPAAPAAPAPAAPAPPAGTGNR